MRQRSSTREILLSELAAMRQRVVELEHGEAAVSLAEEALLRFQKAVETMQIGVTITDVQGTILYTNPADAAMHGYEADELIGRDVGIFAPSKGQRRPLTSQQLALMKSWRRETTNRRKDGTIFPVHLMSDVVKNSDGEPIGVVSTCEDITERKRAEAALRESEERYALAAAGANDGLWDWDLKKNQIVFSPRWKEMLGFGQQEIANSADEWFDRIHPDDRERVRCEIERHRLGLSTHLESEHRVRHRDGSYRWILCRGLAVRDEAGQPYRMAGSHSDFTERKRAEEQLVHDAAHDRLTGLPNRGVIIRAMERSLGRAERRRDYSFAVLYLDVDRFKLFNDSFGHIVGDELLVAIASRLKACVRPSDMLVRLGGDEFALLLEDISDVTDATRVANRIHEALSTPFDVSGQEVFATTGIGIALGGAHYKHPEELLRDADTAMCRAKARGKACHEIFDTAMHKRALEVLQLETGMRWALERDEFLLHYQPIVSLENGEIAGVEALVRWRHPERGLVPPGDFVPVAEESGLIVPIGWRVLTKSCEQMRSWLAETPPRGQFGLSVNISAKQFVQPDVVDKVRSILEETGLEPTCLRLEMTESAVMENAEAAFPRLSELKSLNVSLYVDDFGTGYSSLSYLHRFPIDTLKVDRSFVVDLGRRDEAIEIVRTIIALAHSLKMKVVAEGVETREHVDILRGLECEYAQGYYFSKPITGDAVAALLQKGTRLL